LELIGMRLGIDVRKLGDGGIGVYVRETLLALRALAPDLAIVAFGDPRARALLPIADVEWVAVDAGKYSVAEHFVLPAAARSRGLDLFHAPHYVLPLALTGPAVVTVHDAIHVLHPRTLAHAPYARLTIGFACRRARRVITVSETSARDLHEQIGVPREKIRVIRNGVAARFQPLAADEVERRLAALSLRRGYVLFVGNALPHKNVETVVRAWARLPEPRPELVLCGRGFTANAAVNQALAEATGRERVRIVAASPDELVAIYNGASVVVTASLYEGFCLPVVEAFACGVPVLASDAGAIPEIAGGAALLVPPRRVDLIASEMYRLLTDDRLRRELGEKGLARAATFSWEEAARQTLSVYEEAISR
jgi:alpha-1,3-rhamnosyl/mannosyltransferase